VNTGHSIPATAGDMYQIAIKRTEYAPRVLGTLVLTALGMYIIIVVVVVSGPPLADDLILLDS
jgi:hypothetical protein